MPILPSLECRRLLSPSWPETCASHHQPNLCPTALDPAGSRRIPPDPTGSRRIPLDPTGSRRIPPDPVRLRIGDQLHSLSQLHQLPRPAAVDLSCRSLLNDVLWSDPTDSDGRLGVQPNARGPNTVT